MQKRTDNILIAFNVSYLSLFIPLIGFGILAVWASFCVPSIDYTNIMTSGETVSFIKERYNGLFLVFIGSSGLWYLLNAIIICLFNKGSSYSTEKADIRKGLLSSVSIFILNVIITILAGIIIANTTAYCNALPMGEIIYQEKAVIKSHLDGAYLLLIIAALILIAELIILIRRFYIKSRTPYICIGACGAAILPYISLLLITGI